MNQKLIRNNQESTNFFDETNKNYQQHQEIPQETLSLVNIDDSFDAPLDLNAIIELSRNNTKESERFIFIKSIS